MRLLPGRSAVACLLITLLASCSDTGIVPSGAAERTPSRPSFVIAAPPSIRISEIHYDNTGTDAGEAIEVSAPAGTNLSGYSLVLYNGSGGVTYTPLVNLTGIVADQCSGRGTVVANYAVNGLQNGSPDGVALVGPSGVIEFLSYEGTFAATNGVANGMTSSEIKDASENPISESGSGAVGRSLSRTGGNVWSEGVATFGSCNPGEGDEIAPPPPPPPPPPPLPATRFSEIHYDNNSTDVGEFIEVEGLAGTSLAGWRIQLYNGTDGVMYSDMPLTGLISDQCGGRGAVALLYPTDGVQNGSPDGFALVDPLGAVVEFLSYEGVMTAAAGPTNGAAAGLTSQDIGVSEASSTGLGQSLQRNALGTWTGPAASSYNSCNANGPVTPPSSITFTGRTPPPSDAALPVGFQDQLFATERSGLGAVITTSFTWTSETPAIATVDQDGVITGVSAGSAVFRATATDGTTGTWTLPVIVATPSATASYIGNAEFGEPADGTPADDIILRRTEYTSSFNPVRGIPNWVSYNLEASQMVSGQDRCDCFTYDPLLPDALTRYTTADYTGGGAALGLPSGETLDRGHLARSADRTAGSLDNARTYYFSNIIPQFGSVNQGPWAVMENYLGGLASGGTKELYIIAGATGAQGTVKSEGLITIPSWVWKVAVIMPRNARLSDIDGLEDFEVIAVVMPNTTINRNADWRSFEVTVDSVESLSGYDLLALLRNDLETAAESRTQFPVAATDGPYGDLENLPIAMSAAASSDPDGDALTYRWEFGDGASATGVTTSHAYAAAGQYTIRLIATDIRGLADTATTTATVITPSAALSGPLGLLDAYAGGGILSKGNANSLSAKIEAARRSLDRGTPEAARGQLTAALNELAAMVQSGRLTPAQAEAIAVTIRRALASIAG